MNKKECYDYESILYPTTIGLDLDPFPKMQKKSCLHFYRSTYSQSKDFEQHLPDPCLHATKCGNVLNCPSEKHQPIDS